MWSRNKMMLQLAIKPWQPIWPQERQAEHQTININPMQWNFSGMEGVYPLIVQ